MSKNIPNISYAGTFWTYWSAYAVISSFASVFLLSCGYSNTEIGILIAIGNLLSVVIQPVAASLCDRSKKFNPLDIMMIMVALIIGFEIFTLLIQYKNVVLFCAYIIMFAMHASLQPLLNSISSLFSKKGVRADYGIARGFGSAGYAILCGVLGVCLTLIGVSRLPLLGIIFLICLLVALFVMNKCYREASKLLAEDIDIPGQITQKKDITMSEFIRSHKYFMVLTLGIFVIYYHHQIINFFLLQIFQNVGGDSSDMGTYYSLMSILEMPALFGFSWLNKRLSTSFLVKCGVIGLLLRGITMFIATSPTGILLSLIVNPIGFPLFLAAIVKYIGEIMDEGEAVRGQSLYVIAITASAVVASFTGGFLLDTIGARLLLLICLICCIVGTVIVYPLVGKAAKE